MQKIKKIWGTAIEAFELKKQRAGGWKQLIFYSSLTLTGTSALSYLLGLVRDRTFARTLGASDILDIYNATFVVPDFIFAVIVSGALSAAFVPLFSTLYKKDHQKALQYMNQVLSWMLLGLSLFSAIFAVILPWITQYLVPGFSSQQQQEYVHLTRLMLISPFFFSISNTFGNALLSLKGFIWYGLAPIMYNVGIIFGVMYLYPTMGTAGLVAGTLLGASFHMMVRLQAILRAGFKFQLSLQPSPELKQTFLLMLPKMLQIGLWQYMLLWFVGIASELGTGGITQYNYAYNFQSMPVTLIGIAMALGAYADLSVLAGEKKYDQFESYVKRTLLRVSIITTLAGIGLAAISYPLVSTLFGGGKFSREAVQMTAALLSVFAISVPFESLMHTLARAHYALLNTFRPSAIHIGALLASIVISSALAPVVGLFALPIAFTSGFVIQVVLLSFSLKRLLQEKKAE